MKNCCKDEIICIGEVLWDSLPSGLYLGGAPLNVSLHLRNLIDQVAIASRVGNDRLGKEAVHRIENRNISTNLVQQDEDWETGFVEVDLDEKGNPDYRIVESVAWDRIEVTDPLLARVEEAWAIVFGSLAQRAETTRKTIEQLCRCKCLNVFDINLRPPFIDEQVIENSLSYADILKLNHDELMQLREWYDLPKSIHEAILTLSVEFDIPIIALTCGEDGSALLYYNEWFEHHGFKVDVADAVGAGDAFLSALLYGIKKGEPGDEILAMANATGAYVASQNGAAPEYDLKLIQNIMQAKSR